MSEVKLEHINLSVKSPGELANRLCGLFDWQVRWEGPSIYDGYTVHVGGEGSYLALYTPEKLTGEVVPPYYNEHALNHIGVEVDDLEKVRQRVLDAGLTIHTVREEPPGEGFYFKLEGIEFEVASYA